VCTIRPGSRPSWTGSSASTFAQAAVCRTAFGGADARSGGSGPPGAPVVAPEPESPELVAAPIANAMITISGTVTAVATIAARR
jgi:hypothetical protein